jgi:hypothetical protein
MRIHQEEIVTPSCEEIAHAIRICASEFVENLRRNIVTIKFNELDSQSRAYVEYIAEQELAAQRRVRKIGPHCWYCGSDSKIVRCDCGFGESFSCAERNACQNCATAHRKIANHIRELLKHPRVNRVSSRRFQGYRMLRDAAEAIEGKAVSEGRLDYADTLEVALAPEEDCPWECSTAELRKVLLGSFRKVKFTRFQELAAALQKEIDDSVMRSAVRLLRSWR